MKLRVVNWGFGDIILISNYLKYYFPFEKYELSIGSGINTFLKNNSHKENIIKLFEVILGKENIIWCEDDLFTPYQINHEIFVKMISDNLFFDKNELYHHNNSNLLEDYVVINSKIRNFDKEKYNLIKKSFFEKLNKNKYKIVIIGESSIDYTMGEYNIIGPNRVYSIYEDIYTYIDNSKLIDMTFKGESMTIMNDFFRDMNLILNSKKTIMLGWGGIFCAGIFLNNFVTLFSEKNVWTLLESKVFTDENKFFNSIYLG